MMSVLEVAAAKAFLARARILALNKGSRSVEIDRLVVELAKETLMVVRKHLLSAPLIDQEIIKIYNKACGRNYFFLGMCSSFLAFSFILINGSSLSRRSLLQRRTRSRCELQRGHEMV